jgi:prepilin-type N-terminal cleavage/methylation domain-containing protein
VNTDRKVLVNELSPDKPQGIWSVIPARPVTSATRRGENLSESKKDSRQAGMTQETKIKQEPHAELQGIRVIKKNTNSRGGFTLLEIIVVMGIITLMAGIMIPMVYRLWESNEVDISRERMMDLKIAMVGDPKLVQNGVRTNFGYVGDNGQLPNTISNALFPYLPGGYNPNTYNKDAWGNDFIYTPVQDASFRNVAATLTSRGPDGILGNKDDIDDNSSHNYAPDLQIATTEVIPANIIQGNLNITFQSAPIVGRNIYMGVSVRYRNGFGVLVTEICCDSTMKIIAGSSGNTQINYSQNFSCNPPHSLPVGTAYLAPGLFSDNSCSTSLGGTPLELAANVNNSSIFANLQIQSVP